MKNFIKVNTFSGRDVKVSVADVLKRLPSCGVFFERDIRKSVEKLVGESFHANAAFREEVSKPIIESLKERGLVETGRVAGSNVCVFTLKKSISEITKQFGQVKEDNEPQQQKKAEEAITVDELLFHVYGQPNPSSANSYGQRLRGLRNFAKNLIEIVEVAADGKNYALRSSVRKLIQMNESHLRFLEFLGIKLEGEKGSRSQKFVFDSLSACKEKNEKILKLLGEQQVEVKPAQSSVTVAPKPAPVTKPVDNKKPLESFLSLGEAWRLWIYSECAVVKGGTEEEVIQELEKTRCSVFFNMLGIIKSLQKNGWGDDFKSYPGRKVLVSQELIKELYKIISKKRYFDDVFVLASYMGQTEFSSRYGLDCEEVLESKDGKHVLKVYPRRLVKEEYALHRIISEQREGEDIILSKGYYSKRLGVVVSLKDYASFEKTLE